MLCPHDRTPLSELEYEGALIRECATCGGELVGPDALAHIVRVRERAFDAGLRLHADESVPVRGVPMGEEGRHLNCPCCNGHMCQVNYAGDTRVLVDRCGDCGAVWLDQTELEMAQVLLERWHERAKGQQHRLRPWLDEARQHAARHAAGPFRWSRFSFVNAVLGRIVDAA